MEADLEGKVALITGGGSGIGRSIALALAKEGSHIAIASRNPSKEIIHEIEEFDVRALSLSADVSTEAGVIRMVNATIESLGTIDLFVNNAAGTWHQPITKLSTETWFRTINTNLTSCVWACREVARHMITRGNGSILIVGSTVTFFPVYQQGAYRVSKAGLKIYMETLAIELAPYGIRVNMLTPGHYPTRLTEGIPIPVQEKLKQEIPLRRFGEPEECGATAVLLLSDKLSSYTTGTELIIDGGLSLRPLTMYTDTELYQMNL
jgi:glucose 1-dehydrogenase